MGGDRSNYLWRLRHNTAQLRTGAGTHNHRRLWFKEAVGHRASTENPRRMGPRFGGDDSEWFNNQNGLSLNPGTSAGRGPGAGQ